MRRRSNLSTSTRQAVRHCGQLRASLSQVSMGISHTFRLYFKHSLPFVLTSSRTLTTDKLPVEDCLWYSVFLHASKMSSPSELALDDQSFNDFYLSKFKYSSVWYSVLPRHATNFSEAFKISHDGGTRSKKSMVSTAVLYTPIFELRLIPCSDHSLWCNRPKLALPLLIREVVSSSMQAFCEKAFQVAELLYNLQLFTADLNDRIARGAA